tara:strand:- start:105 stop:494 length:390 start_codon:yes stop_codon:yes gene_type:complete
MKLKNKMRLTGSLFMLISVLLGAIASHYLEPLLSSEAIASFQVGVRYLTYHGLALLLFSIINVGSKKRKRIFFVLITLGNVLFSGSIFLLSFKEVLPFSIGWVGPITPAGGGILILGWCFSVWCFIKKT